MKTTRWAIRDASGNWLKAGPTVSWGKFDEAMLFCKQSAATGWGDRWLTKIPRRVVLVTVEFLGELGSR